jgi:hypothetical protein
MSDHGRSLADEVAALMQRIIGINARWPGDYALFVQSSATAADTVTHFEWYYKPPMAGAGGDMAMLAERPPGYENPEDSP